MFLGVLICHGLSLLVKAKGTSYSCRLLDLLPGEPVVHGRYVDFDPRPIISAAPSHRLGL